MNGALAFYFFEPLWNDESSATVRRTKLYAIGMA